VKIKEPAERQARKVSLRGGHSHDPLIHDWEVQEAYRQYKRRYGDAALDHLTRMYGETIPARNMHLVIGTMLAHPRTLIIMACCARDLMRRNWLNRARCFRRRLGPP
jgi:hypothetical protein